MNRLLVNAPTGEQQIVHVGPGGDYFDASRVLWDERVDGTLPEITLGGMRREGNALTFDEARKAEHDAAAAPKVPQEVTMRQARLALFKDGLLPSVEAAINAMVDPAKTAARIEWDHSQTVRRDKGLVLSLGAAIGLSAAQIDALFVTAAGL